MWLQQVSVFFVITDHFYFLSLLQVYTQMATKVSHCQMVVTYAWHLRICAKFRCEQYISCGFVNA